MAKAIIRFIRRVLGLYNEGDVFTFQSTYQINADPSDEGSREQ